MKLVRDQIEGPIYLWMPGWMIAEQIDYELQMDDYTEEMIRLFTETK